MRSSRRSPSAGWNRRRSSIGSASMRPRPLRTPRKGASCSGAPYWSSARRTRRGRRSPAPVPRRRRLSRRCGTGGVVRERRADPDRIPDHDRVQPQRAGVDHGGTDASARRAAGDQQGVDRAADQPRGQIGPEEAGRVALGHNHVLGLGAPAEGRRRSTRFPPRAGRWPGSSGTTARLRPAAPRRGSDTARPRTVDQLPAAVISASKSPARGEPSSVNPRTKSTTSSAGRQPKPIQPAKPRVRRRS